MIVKCCGMGKFLRNSGRYLMVQEDGYMIKLRLLEEKDAEYMLEWMHDEFVTAKLLTKFEQMDLSDCYRFINKNNTCRKITTGDDLHLAICDNETDEYLGTISLKNIDMNYLHAEYAIVMRQKAIGCKGIAKTATDKILEIAFEKINLNRVYLCVFEDNVRAVRFYEKYHFVYEGMFREHILSKDGKRHNLCWYSLLRRERNI